MWMTRLLFVCHGNICRSPMAEFIMKDLVSKRGLSDSFHIESCATSTEELGNDIYPPAKRCLSSHGIPFDHRSARQMTSDDYDSFDMIIAMDSNNLYNMRRFVRGDPGKKVSLMMEHCGKDRNVADPWYTGDFERTFSDITEACTALLDELPL
jgi:protein-tyrosine phosphatase